MQTLQPIDPAGATGKTKQIFDHLQKNLGMVPNLMRTLANSSAALNAYITFNNALAEAELPAGVREQIAIAVASINACDYCLSAHTALGKLAGLSEVDLEAARSAKAADTRTAAILQFAAAVVRNRGHVASSQIAELRNQGVSDAALAEIVATVALNIFTNYFNHVAGTEIDFPRVHSAVAVPEMN